MNGCCRVMLASLPAVIPPLLWKSGDRYVPVLSDTPPPKRHRPSVEVLFQSGAKIAGLFVRGRCQADWARMLR